MAGRVLFNSGRHPSRGGRRAKQTMGPLDTVKLRIALAKQLGLVSPDDFRTVIREILIARACMPDSVSIGQDGQAVECTDLTKTMTRRDTVAQLKAMKRITHDDALVAALKDCDALTFVAIQRAGLELISEEILRNGIFVDTDGNEYTAPPEIEIAQSSFVYLPAGICGLRQAVDLALQTSESYVDRAGNREKAHQEPLAQLCRYLWGKYQPQKSQKAWCAPNTSEKSDEESHYSELVRFSAFVFGQAGMDDLSPIRITDILNGRKKLSN